MFSRNRSKQPTNRTIPKPTSSEYIKEVENLVETVMTRVARNTGYSMVIVKATEDNLHGNNRVFNYLFEIVKEKKNLTHDQYLDFIGDLDDTIRPFDYHSLKVGELNFPRKKGTPASFFSMLVNFKLNNKSFVIDINIEVKISCNDKTNSH